MRRTALLALPIIGAIGAGLAWAGSQGGAHAFGWPVFGLCVALAFALNAMVASELGLERLPLAHLGIGVVLLWVIGQVAAYAPARRASLIAPATATRSV